MLGKVGGEPISFLLDTGAAVTLIGSDVWKHVNAKQPTKLQSGSNQKLVEVDGSPLEVHGQVHVTVVAQGNTLETQALVVSPLTTEGILGLDFLKKHQATIDVRKRQLRLGSCDCTLLLVELGHHPQPKQEYVPLPLLVPSKQRSGGDILPVPASTGWNLVA